MPRVFDDEDLRRLKEVLDSGHLVSSGGTQVPAFEQEFAATLRSPYAVAVCNAMAGLHAAVAASGAGAGDEVVVDPMVTFASIAAMYNNAIPVYADIDLATHVMDPVSFEASITERTKAVIVTQLWGLCADMDAIVDIARRHGTVVIEDCAHALFATYKGRYAGTLGDIGVFSFQQSKHMTTGDGGGVLCATEELHDRVRAFVHFSTVPPSLAWNFRMNELTGAVARVQLTRAPLYVRECQESASYYSQTVADCDWLVPQATPEGRENAYHIWTAAFYGDRQGLTLDDFQTACREVGFGPNFGYIGKPAYRQEVISEPRAYGRGCPTGCPLRARDVTYSEGLCPNAEELMPRIMLVGAGGHPAEHQAAAERLRAAVEKTEGR